MDTKELIEWYNLNRNLITVLDAEIECKMARGTLSAAIKGARGLPAKFVQPLTVLMDSLTAGSPVKVKPAKGKPSEDAPAKIIEQAAPMLQRPKMENVEQVKPANVEPAKGITRTETTASGLLVQYRDRYPTHNEKHGHNYTLIHSDGNGKPKTYFSGACYMRTGAHRPAWFSFTLEDLK
jgi:hypothetical protein